LIKILGSKKEYKFILNKSYNISILFNWNIKFLRNKKQW